MNLKDVITAAEAARLYGISSAAVRKACEAGQVECRKSGSTWLILKSSADARWNRK